MKFVAAWPSVQALAKAPLDDVLAAWAGLGYYARARNLHKCAIAVAGKPYRGRFPETEEELRELPGIGPYTAAAICSIAFDRPAVAVDGNVERVVSRFFAVTEPLPRAKPALRTKAAVLASGTTRPGDFTQAFMELGATVCTARRPKCGLCPWAQACTARRRDIAEDLPKRTARRAKPVRFGKVYWIADAKGRGLIHKRTQRGLYEGMYQLPTTDWIDDRVAAKLLPPPTPLKALRLRNLGATVRHSFTHFDLILEIWAGDDTKNKNGERAAGGFPQSAWIAPENLGEFALPSLMKKAVRLARGARPRKEP
jgi:A/G-specific adenine glycosylase